MRKTSNTKEKDTAEQIELIPEEREMIQIQSRKFFINIIKDTKEDFSNT